MKQNKINESEKYIKSELELDAFDSTLLMYKGFLEYGDKQYNSSISFLSKSVEHNEDELDGHFFLALNKFALNEYSETVGFINFHLENLFRKSGQS